MGNRLRDVVPFCQRCRQRFAGELDRNQCGWCRWAVCATCMADDYLCERCAHTIATDDLETPPKPPPSWAADGRPLFALEDD